MDLRIFTEPQQGASYDDQLAVAQRAERLGFDAFFAPTTSSASVATGFLAPPTRG